MNNLSKEKKIGKINQKNDFCDSETVLQITNLEKKYTSDSETLTVLHDLNLSVEKESTLQLLILWGGGRK